MIPPTALARKTHDSANGCYYSDKSRFFEFGMTVPRA
jgi:hypothetical protein